MSSSVSHLTRHFTVVFVIIPLILAFLKPHGLIYVVLWLMAAEGWRVLKNYYAYDFQKDWNYAAVNRAVIKRIVLRFLPWATALLFFTWYMVPERLFSLPLEKPLVWAMVMVWYPVLSVFPQEILFRSFFFRHYARWLNTPESMMLVNALAFGWVHIVLHNWVAVTFSFIGSLLFADTYRKTKSLAATCFEHALYGCFIFTIGLGWYFYHGQAVR